MTNSERQVFWEALESAHNPNDNELLASKISYPPKIYRYRKVSCASLSALQANKLFFSSSNFYDDPFDTNIHIDMHSLHNILKEMLRGKTPPEILSIYKQMTGSLFDQELLTMSRDLAKGELKRSLDSIRSDIREKSWSLCFSETGTNENLWIKYAREHKGFVLEYDLSNDRLFICGKRDDCGGCEMSKCPKSLYPMCYRDEKYDATKFALCYFLERFLLEKNTQESRNARDILVSSYPFYWERERITLIKKECHHYDQEWRIVIPDDGTESKPYLCWIPSAVILGLNTPEAEKDLILICAQKAGIPSVKQVFINDEDELDVRKVCIS